MQDRVGLCALCQLSGPLCVSHVLPAFIFKEQRRRSATGHIRNSENPNLRSQDGLKKPWLCRSCESLFSRFETSFSSRIFHPWLKGKLPLPYEEWMLKFCTSVSWRVLKHCRDLNNQAHYSDEQNRLLTQAEQQWRGFLLGHAPHPASFHQHLMMFDCIEQTTFDDLPININRWLLTTTTLDIVGSERSLFTMAKMGRFCLFGQIQAGPDRWENTKIHLRSGCLKKGKVIVPYGLMNLFEEKAAVARNAMEKMSDAQQLKVQETLAANEDRLIRSDQFRAMQADYDLHGPRVFEEKA